MPSTVDIGTEIGSRQVTTVSTWSTLGSTDFTSAATAQACRQERVFSQLVVTNTHESGTVYVLLAAAADVASGGGRDGISDGSPGETPLSPTTDKAIPVAPGCSFTLPIYGLRTRRIAVTGSTTGVTASLTAWFYNN